MNTEISFGYLFKILKNAWLKIVIFTVLAAVAAGLFTAFVIPKKYDSKIEFYIVNTSSDVDYATGTLLSAVDYLANDYIAILQSDFLLTEISQRLKDEHGIEYTPEDIRGMFSSETKVTTSIFSVTIKAQDPHHAHIIASYISERASDVIMDFAKPGEWKDKYLLSDGEVVEIIKERQVPIKVLREPQLNEAPVSPSLFINVALTTFLVAVAIYLIYFLKDLLDSTIRTEENVKEQISHPLIGTIPEWKIHSSKKD